MGYRVQDVQGQLSIDKKDIEEVIKEHNIRVAKDGTISTKSYKLLLKLNEEKDIKDSNNNTYSILNGHDLRVKSKPIYESSDKRISFFQDDAISFLRSLPAKSVDLIVTDPAYSGMNQKLKLGKGKIIGEYKKAGEANARWFEEFHDTEENYKSFLSECYRVLKDNTHIYIMFDSYSLLTLAPVVREVFEVKNLLCWDKVNIGLGHYFRRRHEFIMFASKGKKPLNSKSIPDVWRIKRVANSQYPTQKPTEVFELMLKGSASRDFVVCDPFMGSGSSAIAAIKQGCKFVGSDISSKSIEFSSERIEHYLQSNKDIYQKASLIGDDDSIIKLLLHGQS